MLARRRPCVAADRATRPGRPRAAARGPRETRRAYAGRPLRCRSPRRPRPRARHLAGGAYRSRGVCRSPNPRADRCQRPSTRSICSGERPSTTAGARRPAAISSPVNGSGRCVRPRASPSRAAPRPASRPPRGPGAPRRSSSPAPDHEMPGLFGPLARVEARRVARPGP